MANETPPLSIRLFSLIEPAFMLKDAVRHFLAAAWSAIVLHGDLSALLRPSSLRDAGFSRFWLKLTGQTPFRAPHSCTAEPSLAPDPANVPDNPADLVGSAALIPPLLASATGLVLDIGPGSGAQVRYFARSNAISRIYGAEPSKGLHAQLTAQAAAHGLADRYTVLGCTAEPRQLAAALAAAGVKLPASSRQDAEGVFDTIVCVRVMCSVSQPQEVARNLYRLLKPGGQLLTCEHVVGRPTASKGSVLARIMQTVYGLLGWSYFFAGCELTRDTYKTLEMAAEGDGGWDFIELDRSFPWAVLTYISGRFVKKA